MSLFDVEKNANILHAVNCQGVWGAGIAGEFKKRFPEAFQNYNEESLTCADLCLGDYGYYSYGKDLPTIMWIYTSFGYGFKKDPKDKILFNTKSALLELLSSNLPKDSVIYSNKFNSGLFGVPWSETEEILLDCLTNHNPNNVKWIICDPDLEK